MSGRVVLEIIHETCLFANAFDTVERKDLLSKVLLEYFPNTAKTIFSGMQDRYSLSHELERAVARLEDIKWII